MVLMRAFLAAFFRDDSVNKEAQDLKFYLNHSGVKVHDDQFHSENQQAHHSGSTAISLERHRLALSFASLGGLASCKSVYPRK